MSRNRLRIVVDTNVLVSAVARAGSVPGQAVSLAQKLGILLLSDETASELTAVLARHKMSRYVTDTDVMPAITALCATAAPNQFLGRTHAGSSLALRPP